MMSKDPALLVRYSHDAVESANTVIKEITAQANADPRLFVVEVGLEKTKECLEQALKLMDEEARTRNSDA